MTEHRPEDRRGARRSRGLLMVVVRDIKEGTRRQGSTKDFGSQGLCVVVNGPHAEGTQVEIELSLPDSSKPVIISGRDIWCIMRETKTMAVPFEMGIAFENLTREHQMVIRGAAALYGLPDFSLSPPSS